MKAIKSFFYGNIGATAGDDINISDKNIAEALIAKKIIENDEKSEQEIVQISKKKNVYISEQKIEGNMNAQKDNS
mgnify:FL=1